MRRTVITKAFLVSCAFAAATACGNGANSTRETPSGDAAANGAQTDRSANDRGSLNTSAANTAEAQTPIDVTGCLQKGDGSAYILTRVNEPAQKEVGSSGTPAAVEREQMRAAASAYRVNPAGNVKIDELVGKQVRVSGTIARNASAPGAQASSRDDRGTAGSNERQEIKEGDLARIDATSVAMVAQACGENAPPAPRHETGGGRK